MKIRKTLLSALSAVLCVAMLLGISVFAEGAAEDRNIWKETKALTSAKYYSEYIRLTEKYSAKESKKSVTFGKSLTKKFYEDLFENIVSDDPEFVYEGINRDEIFSVAVKDGKFKFVIYSDNDGAAIFLNKKEMTVLSVNDNEKMTLPLSDDEYAGAYDEFYGDFADDVDNGYSIEENFYITDSTKGKYFKIKSGDKTYYYEEFEDESEVTNGFLFNSKGKPIAAYSDGEAYCLNFSCTVSDSEFEIPSGYKEIV